MKARDRFLRCLFALWNRGWLQALIGAGVVGLLLPRLYGAEPSLFGPAHVLLLFAVLVVTPLALPLAAIANADGKQPILYRAALSLWPVAAASTAASFVLPAGRTAALLAGPWLLFAALVAAFAGLRFYRRKGARLRLADLAIDIGLFYLLPAARWLFVSRAGIEVPRVPGLIVVLTAIHFHYTFFAATVVAGLLGQHLSRSPSAWAPRLAGSVGLGVLIGPLLIATGINKMLPVVEVAGALILVSSLLLGAVLTVRFVARPPLSVLARRLLQVAAVTLGGAMLLAASFAVGKYAGLASLSFHYMIRLHGIANALFVSGSLLGLQVARGGALSVSSKRYPGQPDGETKL